jgi:hypothetical protein
MRTSSFRTVGAALVRGVRGSGRQLSLAALLAGTSVAAVVGAVEAGCSGSADSSSGAGTGATPIFNAVDPSKTCPAGYVGWNFATGGAGPGVVPAIHIVSAACVSPDGGSASAGGDAGASGSAMADLTKACEGKSDCMFSESGAGCSNVHITYMCGSSSTTIDRTFLGADTLSCLLPFADDAGTDTAATSAAGDSGTDFHGGLNSVIEPTGKACVPKSCPANTKRTANMQCVAEPKTVPDRFDVEVPTLTAVDDTTADPTEFSLVTNTRYNLQTVIAVGAQPPVGRVLFWLADVYRRKDGSTNQTFEGFRCTFGDAAVSASDVKSLPWSGDNALHNQYDVQVLQTATPVCTDPMLVGTAHADAAQRAGMSVTDFDAMYAFSAVTAHASFDMDGVNNFAQNSLDSIFRAPSIGCAPNPPGFYYHASSGDGGSGSYVNLYDYLGQREPAIYSVDPIRAFVLNDDDGAANHTELNVGGVLQGAGKISQYPTQIRMSALAMRVDTPTVDLPKFGSVTPVINADISYVMVGDESPLNPYGFSYTGAGIAGFKSLADRNFRADVYADVSGGGSILLGSVPLTGGVPSGTTVTSQVVVTRPNVKQFFDTYLNATSFSLRYCLNADGFTTGPDPVTNQNHILDLPHVTGNDGTVFGAGFMYGSGHGDQNCVSGDTVIAITRDFESRPSTAISGTSQVDNSADQSSGDSTSNGKQSNDAESGCVGNTCSNAQSLGMSAGGLGGTQIFNAVSTGSETSNANGSGTGNLDLSASAMGYTIIDLPDDGSHGWASEADVPQDGLEFAVSINVPPIVAALREAATGTPEEIEQGVYGGQSGVGVAIGYKTFLEIGPIPGTVDVGVSAGVSLALKFVVKTAPDTAYPCISPAQSSTCFALDSDSNTQDNAQGDCTDKGGKLAEVHSADDLVGLRAAGAGMTGTYWVGGQQSYQYASASCADLTSANSADCASKAAENVRWISDDAIFASATGSGPPVPASSAFVAATDLNLVSQLPTETALVYNAGTKRLELQPTNQLNPGICEFELGTKENYRSFGGGIELGVAAGLFMEFCSPDDDIGICVDGAINFVDIKLGFEVDRISRTVTRASDGSTFTVGGTKISVPWSLDLLSGEAGATFEAYFFSYHVTFAHWPGFQVANGSLFTSFNPSIEN